MIGRTVSHYRIVRELGAGGMGVVYEAVDTLLDRTVALKFLPSELTDSDQARARFVREAKTASALDHPNVCTVFEIDETDDGRMFLAMACYRGETLRERIARGPLPLDEAMDIARQAAEGLARAHGRDIVHRDIKPANLFLTDDYVKILDFGVAKLEGRTRITRTGTALGTTSYMSPEQVRGEDTDARSDIWSLGVVLYEMVTGRPPFVGEPGHAVVHAILKVDPTPVTGLRTGVPRELERIIGKCLAKDPRERYQHAEDLLVDLRVLRRRTDEQTTATMVAPDAPRKVPRRWSWIVGCAAVIVLVLVLAIGLREADDQAPGPDTPLLAVLPFEDLGTDGNDLLGDGLAEAIITRLAGISEIGVISRASSRQYKGTSRDMADVARELGADFIVGGTVLGGTGTIRVMPHLLDPRRGVEIWADTYDVAPDDIFTLQSEIAESIVGALRIGLPAAEQSYLRASPTDDLEAYEAYLRGRSHAETLEGRNAALAIRNFEIATTLDPDFALAWAQLGKMRAWVVFHGEAPVSELEKADAAIRRAFAAAPDLPEAHVARGYYDYWGHRDYDAADVQFRLALARQPHNVQALEGLGLTLRRRGFWQEGLVLIERAHRLSPRESDLVNDLTQFYWANGRLEDALAMASLNIAMEPTLIWARKDKARLLIALDGDVGAAAEAVAGFPVVSHSDLPLSRILVDRGLLESSDIDDESGYYRRPQGLLAIAQVQEVAGQAERAAATYERSRALWEEFLAREGPENPQNPQNRAWYGLVLACLGRTDEAVRIGERALAMMPAERDAPEHLYCMKILTETQVRAGNVEAALQLLERLSSGPVVIDLTPHFLRLDPIWDPLRGHPRFEALAARETPDNPG